MSGIFAGKVALVTGAARGIGAAIARMFAVNGANVVLGDLLPEVEETGSQIKQSQVLVGDVTDPEYCNALTKIALDQFGSLDFAVNNAGIGGTPCPIEDVLDEQWQKVVDINLSGVFYGLRSQIPAMIQSGGGVVVNVSSVLGLKPIPGQSLEYTAAKHGVIGLTRQVAVNYGDKGIRCNAVCPGYIETPLTMANDDSHAGSAYFVERTPLGRCGQPEDIAGVVKMLCSNEAGYVNGVALQVDGGFVLT